MSITKQPLFGVANLKKAARVFFSKVDISLVPVAGNGLLQLHIATCPHGRLYLQVHAEGSRCNVTGETRAWSGRKWFLSEHMTKTELVQTAFKAVMTAVEHEVREQFLYRGVSIFDGHLDVDRLVEFRAIIPLDERPREG